MANEQLSTRKWLMSNPLVRRLHYNDNYCFELMQMKKPWVSTIDLDPSPIPIPVPVPVLVRKQHV